MPLLAHFYSAQFDARVHLAGMLRRLRRTALSPVPKAPGNVLFVLTGLLGDSVMCTPVLAEARRIWPNARITVLGKRANAELLGELSTIDQFLVTTAIPFSLRRRLELRELDAMLKNGKFDLAIILLGDQFAPALERAGIPVRVGVADHPLAPFLTHTYNIRSAREWGPDERLNALRILGYEAGAASPTLQTSPSAQQSARSARKECGAKDEAYAVVHPFGSTARQHWPVQRLERLAKALRERYSLELVLVGGPEWSGANKSVGAGTVNMIGCLSLPELVATIQGADVVITTDSGPFHIAGGLSRPTVGLFRRSRPEHGQRYFSGRVVLGEHPSCGGCRWDWCRVTPCASMQSICVEDIMVRIEEVLKTRENCMNKGLDQAS